MSTKNFDSESTQSPSKVVSFAELAKLREEKMILNSWIEYFANQSHENLLQALVNEHENNFPLRSSFDLSDQLKHRALVEVLQNRAQTQFLRAFLEEVESRSLN